MSTIENRLARLFETPLLARVVPQLPAETLHQLIRHRGLDACGELIASATPAQLTTLLDLDLWRPAQPGCDAQLDIDRFGEWVEALVDTGDSVAARTVAALDTGVVIAGLSRYVRVLDPGIFEPVAQSDDEPIDRHEAMRDGDSDTATRNSSSDRLDCEVGGYIVRARRADLWDAIVTLLTALDAEHGTYFHAVMQGCRRLSNSMPEIDGLDDLLLAPEQHLHNVAMEREHRQSQQGYATPADARAFLQMTRQPADTQSVNPIVAAYFRAADEASESSPEITRPHADVTDAPESIAAVVDLLAEAGMMPLRPRALLAAADADPQTARLTRVRQLMEDARDRNPAVYFTRNRELAFLANTLLAGCSVQLRPFTPQEASDAAASICNLGLEYSPETLEAESSRGDHALVTAFEVGWSVLQRDVSMFVAEHLISTLDVLRRVVDREFHSDLRALRRTLVQHRDAGTPWLARGATDVLAMVDVTAWIGVCGLLDECPVMPAAVTAILDGRTTRVSPTAFDFISTAAQIEDIRNFMRKLPEILSS
jgi:hypothetical protein